MKSHAFSGMCLAILATWVAVSAAALAEVQPRVVATQFATDDVVIASVVVDADKTGATDATPAIQAAIDEVAAAGGGVVFVPAGRYRLEGAITVKEAVTLRGDWAPPTNAEYVNGTVLMPVGERGNAEGAPAITVERGAGVREVAVWYPEQNPVDIVPYPWTFRTSTSVNGDNYTVKNVTMMNAYQAFKTGPEGNELHTLRNVYGTPLKCGIWIDSTTDIGRVINVDFDPKWWEESGLPGAPSTQEAREALRGFLMREGVGLDMGRSDWEYLYDLRVTGYGVGAKIRQGERGTTNAVMFGSRLLECGTALLLEKLNGVGFSATGCRFGATNSAVHAPASFDTVTQFNTCTFEGTPQTAVLLEGSGLLTFQNCRFESWSEVAVAAASGRVSIVGCAFAQAGSHIRLGADLMRARVLSNAFEGSPTIIDEAKRGDVMIAHEAMTFDTPDVSLAPVPKHPRPATDQLFDVTTYGASAEAADNTVAFTKALAAAQQAGGGTVYVPAGDYRFAGQFIVPSGVELRGCFDVPHHTQSGGSVLMPTAGKGEEDGMPFIRLDMGSGIRGLTIWYPEQSLTDIKPYPWAIQALGPRCWVLDAVVSNAYQGVDFWSYPSDGHVIRYLSGAVLRRGLFVSKCRNEGWVEDVQFNPHYGLRLPKGLPRPKYDSEPFAAIIAQQRRYLEGLVFGNCAQEHLTRNFLYAAHDGIAFVDDNGGTNGRIINHGTDTGSRAAVLAAVGAEGLEFINAQLVPLGDWEVGGLIVEDSFAGKASFFNSQMWAGNCSGLIAGTGDVLLQQLNTLSGPITVSGGRCRLEGVRFDRDLDTHIAVNKCESARLVGNLFRGGALKTENTAGDACRILASSSATRPVLREGNAAFATGWEEDEPQGLVDTVREGGRRSVSGGTCGPVDGDAHTGSHALRFAGTADDPSYSYAYFKVFDGPLQINPGAVLSYWFKPMNERARHVCIDLSFDDGKTLRDSGIKTTDGVGIHPGSEKGTVGEWKLIEIPLGRFAGEKTIESIMFGYDSRSGGGPFEALVDDLKLEAPDPVAYQARAEPQGGLTTGPVSVTITVPKAATVRYTADGSNPTADSHAYSEPIKLEAPGLHEVRFAVELPDGSMSDQVFGELYEIQP